MSKQQAIKPVYRQSKVGSIFLNQNDVISIGNSILVENHEKPFEREIKIQKSARYEFAAHENPLENIFGFVIKFVGFLTVAVIFWTILKYGISSSSFSIEIYPGTIVSICFFFISLVIAVYFISAKKKLKLRVDRNNLHISSFPNFSQKIPVEYVNACYTDISRYPGFDNRIDLSDFERSRKTKVDLERGILIQLKNGKNFTILSTKSSLIKNTQY
ncbi:MAG: hypothetical protein V1720_03300 [bacterium]